MKSLYNYSIKSKVSLLLIISAITFSFCNDIFAQDARKKIAGAYIPQEQIPGTRKMTKSELAKVAFNQKISPVEKIQGDYVACGISLRNRGGGVINLRGAPLKSIPIKAYLYWTILNDYSDSTMSVSVNGVSVKGVQIGQGPSPCWAPGRNFVYRAIVQKNLLYIGINGDYKIAGVPSGDGFGMSPWESIISPLAEGTTLVVFFSNPNSPSKITYVYEAPVSGQMFAGTFSTTLIDFSPAPNSTAKFTLVGADGQIGSGLESIPNITDEISFFQGTQIASPPVPPSLNADSDWNGKDLEPLNQLWDTRTHIVPINQKSISAEVKYISHGDCLVIVAFFLGL